LTLTAESISWAIGRIFYPAWTKNSSYYSCRPEPERIALLVSDCRSGAQGWSDAHICEREPPFKEVPAMEAAEIDYRALKSFLS
jgi:hypothetical protein